MTVNARLDPTLAHRDRYRHWHALVPRFGDLDVVGHVSHVNLVRWFEEGRVALELPIQPISALRSGPVIVLAEIRIQFREEAHFGDSVDIGTGVQRIGTSSVIIGQGIFVASRCVATAEVVEVLIDQDNRKPTAWPFEFRALLEQYLMVPSQPAPSARPGR